MHSGSSDITVTNVGDVSISTWDDVPDETFIKNEAVIALPHLTNAELLHLRVRVIALENLVMAILAEGSERQLATALEMAGYISPRPGFTQHPLTIHAAGQMTQSVERAQRFRFRYKPTN